MHISSYSGQIVSLQERRIFPGVLHLVEGRIVQIEEVAEAPSHYILPGFVDAHVHVESAMLPPVEFGRMALVHGTLATVSDPHEIANVLGNDGIRYMLDQAQNTPLKICFGMPSCVPATEYESAGASLGPEAVAAWMAHDEIYYLAEVMNFPGVLAGDPDLLAKIQAAHQHGKPVDGHAPGLRGKDAATYVRAGIGTDHECTTYAEAKEKLDLGMHLLIREGSSARNFEALIDLLPDYPLQVMFCSDDKHPDDLLIGHINQLAARAVQRGIALFTVLDAACRNPVRHYKIPIGQLREGDSADFIVVEDLTEFRVKASFVAGKCVAEQGKSLLDFQSSPTPNQFVTQVCRPEHLEVQAIPGTEHIRVIEAVDGALITHEALAPPLESDEHWVADPDRDILKLVVWNRYEESLPAVAFIKGFGFQKGAIASSVAHDSHNLIAVGADDQAICQALNFLMQNKGGIALSDGQQLSGLALPIAGLMSDLPAETVASQYRSLDQGAKKLGSSLRAPFMTLSFMALLVIPSLKLSDRGLFDGEAFRPVSLSPQVDSQA